jgi:hypothetical protein
MATCDASAHVCVTVCRTTTIASQVNLDAARYCREIAGDLLIEPNFVSIDAAALPYLTSVTGDVSAASVAATQSVAESITLPALERIGGDLRFRSLPQLRLVNLPRLAQLEGSVEFGLLPLERLSLPQLAAVGGDVTIASGLQTLSQLDVAKLTSVDGALVLFGLCRLPWPQVEAISSLGSTRTISDIGCCTTLASHACVTNICSCN